MSDEEMAAHQVVRDWLSATPAVEARIGTVRAQRELERLITAAIQRGYRRGYGDADNGNDPAVPLAETG